MDDLVAIAATLGIGTAIAAAGAWFSSAPSLLHTLPSPGMTWH